MLEWNAYYESWNDRKIKSFNIFEHGRLMEDLRKNAKKIHIREDIPSEKEWFLDQLRRDIQYYFWSKCEWELVLAPWVGNGRTQDIKIDVYDQVMLNWPVFSEYVWQNRKELRKKE